MLCTGILVSCGPGQLPAAPTKTPLIGYLAPAAPGPSPYYDALIDGLRDEGYVLGRNIDLEARYAEEQPERFPQLVQELLDRHVDVIVASSSPAAVAAQSASSTIPIIFVGVGDPIGVGLIDSFDRPGRNATGTTTYSPELSSKRMEYLREALPAVQRVFVLWNEDNPVKKRDLEETRVAGALLGLDVESAPVRAATDFEPTFQAEAALGCPAVVVLSDPLTVRAASRIADFAAKHKMPGIYEGREFAEAGGLMSYAANRADYYRGAAKLVAKVLRGTSPGELPVERPTVFEFIANRDAERKLGVDLQPAVVARVDEIIGTGDGVREAPCGG